MKITVLTLFPKMIEGFFAESIIKRAQEKGLVEIDILNIRDFASDSYKTVDDKPYGGGAGMVLKVDVSIALFKNTIPIPNTEYESNINFLQRGCHLIKRKQELAKLSHLVL